ncbi:MAG: OmpA family protein [Saprospirales bacterium]|jgi:chemotaxis protein MotB|nr:OmpA family protein [Saprospirales bacterium]
MFRSQLFSFFAVLSLGVLMIGCVPMKKYQELELIKNHYKDEADGLKTVRSENELVKERLTSCDAQLKQSVRANEELTVRNESLERNYADLEGRFNGLLEQNKALIYSSSDEKEGLLMQLTSQQSEIERQRQELASIRLALDEREGNMDQLRSNLDERERRLAELEAMIQAKEAQMVQLRESLNRTLLGFSAVDLTITEQNGKLYVSLSQNLLFKSGSDQIDFKGKNALKSVAEALNSNPDIDIMVEGHTDSDGTPAANWDLSTRRATAVVKILGEFGVNPGRMTAAGRALYAPVAPNDDANNKARNRRTEIILSPKLDQLYQIIKS